VKREGGETRRVRASDCDSDGVGHAGDFGGIKGTSFSGKLYVDSLDEQRKMDTRETKVK